MSLVHIYFSVDGVEYDPFGDITDPSPSTTVNATFVGGDCLVSTNVDTSLDYVKVGYTGYGTDEAFTDDFGSTGFPLWTYSPGGSSAYLTEGSGVAHMQYNTSSPGGTNILKTGIAAPYANVYCEVGAKCASPAKTGPPLTNCPCYFDFAEGTVLFMSDAVMFDVTALSATAFQAVDLNDGSFHSVGIRRQVTDFAPFNPVAASISHTFGLA